MATLATPKAGDVKGSGGNFLSEPGKYHVLIEQVLEGQSEKGEPRDGDTVKLKVLAGSHRNKTCTITLWYPDASKSEESQMMAIRQLTNFYIASNVIQPEQLGQEIEYDPSSANGHQVVIHLARQQKNENGKWVDDPESKFLRVHFDDVFHVDDPEIATRAKFQDPIARCSDSLAVIDSQFRRDSSWFSFKNVQVAGAESSEDADDMLAGLV